MSAPQLENGYTRIANELIDALCTLPISGGEWSVVMAVIRKTYGFQKKADWISNNQLAEMTGMRRERVVEAKSKLIKKGVLIKSGKSIMLNKDYQQWQLVRKSVLAEHQLVRKSVLPSTEKRTKTSTEKRTHKRNKENIQKKDVDLSALRQKAREDLIAKGIIRV